MWRDAVSIYICLCFYLFEGNHPDEAADAGDVGVVEAQQGEDGVSLWGKEDGIINQKTSEQFEEFWLERESYINGNAPLTLII